jgi:L-ribulose-5-phosphate 3-epimerase UlaE
MDLTRRRFSKVVFYQLPLTLAAVVTRPGLLEAQPVNKSGALPILGLNTWSLRALKHDQAIPAILKVMKETGLQNCQLLFSHAEPEAFDPDFAAMFSAHCVAPTQQERDAQKRKSEARAAWRLSVPMSYFEGIRSLFEQQGLRIRSYGVPFGETAEEVDRVFLMAKTLGATVVNGRLAEAQTDMVAAAALRHGMTVGIQVSDVPLLEKQLRAHPNLRADPDLGDLTKAGVSALGFVKEHLASISSIDLKDALPHGGSVPFGTGDAKMREVLEFLSQAKSSVEIYIDCDYPGTGSSTDEVKKCVKYVRDIIGT